MKRLQLAVLLCTLFVSASAMAENWMVRVRAVNLDMENTSDAMPGVPADVSSM